MYYSVALELSHTEDIPQHNNLRRLGFELMTSDSDIRMGL